MYIHRSKTLASLLLFLVEKKRKRKEKKKRGQVCSWLISAPRGISLASR